MVSVKCPYWQFQPPSCGPQRLFTVLHAVLEELSALCHQVFLDLVGDPAMAYLDNGALSIFARE
jgi:hypothetical protein